LLSHILALFLSLQGMPLEEVEQLMQDSADAKDYEDSLRQMLGKPACRAPASQTFRHTASHVVLLYCSVGLPARIHAAILVSI
jgi:hypothetical protein